MDAEKYTRNVQLHCPTCGGDMFEYEDGGNVEVLKCAACEREIAKDDLLRENSENFSEHLEEMAQEVVKDAAEELRATLKKAFRGNKYIKFK